MVPCRHLFLLFVVKRLRSLTLALSSADTCIHTHSYIHALIETFVLLFLRVHCTAPNDAPAHATGARSPVSFSMCVCVHVHGLVCVSVTPHAFSKPERSAFELQLLARSVTILRSVVIHVDAFLVALAAAVIVSRVCIYSGCVNLVFPVQPATLKHIICVKIYAILLLKSEKCAYYVKRRLAQNKEI